MITVSVSSSIKRVSADKSQMGLDTSVLSFRYTVTVESVLVEMFRALMRLSNGVSDGSPGWLVTTGSIFTDAFVTDITI